METPEHKQLTALVQRTCQELEIPDRFLVRFAADVAGCVRDMRLNPVAYDEGVVFRAIYDYEMMILKGQFEPSMWENPASELTNYAATTAAYFLAKEVALKDEKLKNLFGHLKKGAR